MTANSGGQRTVSTSEAGESRSDPMTDAPLGSPHVADPIIESRDLDVYYGDDQALHSIDMEIPEQQVTALIGPSGCGKSTFLRSINRMNDLIDIARVDGDLSFRGKNVYDEDVDPVALRRKIGMVFQKPNPFPKSIFDNVAYGLRVQGKDGADVDVEAEVRTALERAALLEEVEDQLDESGLELSGGQQQRLCIARAIAPDPEVILMDEPASALDPVATSKIEDLSKNSPRSIRSSSSPTTCSRRPASPTRRRSSSPAATLLSSTTRTKSSRIPRATASRITLRANSGNRISAREALDTRSSTRPPIRLQSVSLVTAQLQRRRPAPRSL